jgi:hypothetical protein
MMQKMQIMSSNFGMGASMPHINAETINVNNSKEVNRNLKNETPSENLEFKGDKNSKCLNLLVDNGGHRIPEIVKLADEANAFLESVELHKPTLDDVFLSVTGRNIREEEGNIVDMMRRHRIIQQARGRQVRG